MAVAKKTARKTVKAVDTAAEDASTTVEAAAKGALDQFETLFAAFSDNAETMRDQTEELFDTIRNNYETAQSRFKETSADLVEDARKEMAEAVDYVNSLARVTSVADALELHRDYWTNLFETRVARTKELTEASAEAAREAFEPYSKTLSTFSFDTGGFEKFFPFSAK
jgi:hypothetical protein